MAHTGHVGKKRKINSDEEEIEKDGLYECCQLTSDIMFYGSDTKCIICMIRGVPCIFKSKTALRRHAAEQHGKDQFMVVCELCRSAFETRSGFRGHSCDGGLPPTRDVKITSAVSAQCGPSRSNKETTGRSIKYATKSRRAMKKPHPEDSFSSKADMSSIDEADDTNSFTTWHYETGKFKFAPEVIDLAPPVLAPHFNTDNEANISNVFFEYMDTSELNSTPQTVELLTESPASDFGAMPKLLDATSVSLPKETRPVLKVPKVLVPRLNMEKKKAVRAKRVEKQTFGAEDNNLDMDTIAVVSQILSASTKETDIDVNFELDSENAIHVRDFEACSSRFNC